MRTTFSFCFSGWIGALVVAAGQLLGAVPTAVRVVRPVHQEIISPVNGRPAEYRYAAFPTMLRIGPDDVWIAYKVGRTHATDAGAAIEVVSHSLSSHQSRLIDRLVPAAPKLYQMGELTRFPDGSVAVFIDVQAVGWDGRNSRTGATSYRWNAARNRFDGPTELGPVDGILYGYPLDFAHDAATTWQLIMAFGYHLPGGRWSVDALRSEDSGRSWRLVRNLTQEFGAIQANESGFVPFGDGFIVTTRGYDRIERLHQTDRQFKVRRQTELTGKYPFIHSYIGRPRIFIRDGQGYILGRNWTRPIPAADDKAAPPSEMQLCLIRFNPDTLDVTAGVILDNAEQDRVTDGYYAVAEFSGGGTDAQMHVITYKALRGAPPDIVRLDYRWAEVK